jgi:predicted Zn finger-like uncharacterized protein
MFTVCPKCALTLVVTAADLRVAQGYVRCGRCSNVFNALSRLSEDRQAGAAAAQPSPESAAAPKPAPPGQDAGALHAMHPPLPQRTDAGATSSRVMPDPAATSRTRQASELSASRKVVPPPPATTEPTRYDDDSSIPEEDLEFNPDATDLNQVFVEPPPSPKFTAATGTFKAIRLEAQDTARAAGGLTRTDEHENSASAPRAMHGRPAPEDIFDPIDTQVDVEIDPDLLATMAHLTNNRLERLNPTPDDEPEFSSEPLGEPPPAARPAAPPQPATPANSTSDTSTNRALVPSKSPSSGKQPMLLQPPMEQPPQPPATMRLAERAKARAQAARTGTNPTLALDAGARPDIRKADVRQKPETKQKPDTRPTAEVPKPEANFSPDDTRGTALETAAALRDALAPRKRTFGLDAQSAEQPTSFFAGMWTAGSAVLLLMLLIQIVHHYRHDLAANATFNGPLTSIYAVLGIPIVPRWDLGSYDVRQLGASTAADAPGQITVRASVKNGAHQAQPLPLLRVTLQDRFGNRIASRDVPPQSYLPRAIPRTSLLSAGQRIDAEMGFVDPGSNAVGFEIDACLPAPGGGFSCANDIAP